jgi:hypothetical protein
MCIYMYNIGEGDEDRRSINEEKADVNPKGQLSSHGYPTRG